MTLCDGDNMQMTQLPVPVCDGGSSDGQIVDFERVRLINGEEYRLCILIRGSEVRTAWRPADRFQITTQDQFDAAWAKAARA